MKVQGLFGKTAVLALLTLGACLILSYYYSVAGGRPPWAAHRYTVTAFVSESQQLLKHADVRAAGVKVGTVSGITNHGRTAKVTMDLDEDVAPINVDATVLVRQKTLVGENYIALDPGRASAGTLPDGSTLPQSHDKEAVALDRVLNSLDSATRSHVRDNLRALGAGFKGRGTDLNRALDALTPALTDGGQVMSTLESQRVQVADIVQQAGTIVDALGNRTEDLRELITSAKRTAEAVNARDVALKQAFDELPRTLHRARGATANLSAFSSQATPVARNLRVALRDVGPVLTQLRATVGPGQELFERLPALIKNANPLLQRIPEFSAAGKNVMPGLEALLRQANPALDYLRPYYRDLGSLFSNLGTGQEFDKWGSQIRCACPASERSFSNWTPAMRKAVNALIRAGMIAKLEDLQPNVLRAPGSMPDVGKPFTGTYPRVLSDPAP